MKKLISVLCISFLAIWIQISDEKLMDFSKVKKVDIVDAYFYSPVPPKSKMEYWVRADGEEFMSFKTLKDAQDYLKLLQKELGRRR